MLRPVGQSEFTVIISKARAIAKMAHRGQKYGPADYFFFHVENVVRRVISHPLHTQDAVAVAYLHDVLEDTEVTPEELGILGIPMHIIDAVRVLSRSQNEMYLTYINRVLESGSATAILVKYCDLRENVAQCVEQIIGFEDPMTRERAASLRKRYVNAMTLIRGEGPKGIAS